MIESCGYSGGRAMRKIKAEAGRAGRLKT